MTKSYDLKKYPEADYTPNDIGPPERVGQNQPLTDEERADYEEKLDEMENDLIF